MLRRVKRARDSLERQLWLYDGTKGLLHAVERDEAAMARIQTVWDDFQRFLDTDTPAPLTEADTVVRGDQELTQAAQAFQAADAAGETLEKASQALLALATHPKESGAGVTVTRFWKAGALDYKKIPALQGLDLSPWRGKGREEVRVVAS
jgi:hypothetical protein